MASEKRSDRKCCFKGCTNQGVPRNGYNFFACDACLDKLERCLQFEYLKRIQRHLNNGDSWVIVSEREFAMLAIGSSLKMSALDALKDVFPYDALLSPELSTVRVLKDAARNASLERRYSAMIADARLLYIEKSLFLSVPPKHMETALHSLAVLHEVFRRIGMPLSDASVKVNSLECRYSEIH